MDNCQQPSYSLDPSRAAVAAEGSTVNKIVLYCPFYLRYKNIVSNDVCCWDNDEKSEAGLSYYDINQCCVKECRFHMVFYQMDLNYNPKILFLL